MSRSLGQISVTTALVAVVLVACGSDGDSSPSTSTATVAASTSTVAASTSTVFATPADDVVAAGGTRLDVPGEPDWLVVAGGSAWTTANGLTRLDGTTGDVMQTISIDGIVCLAMDAGLGSVWVGTCDTSTIVRIDESTGGVQAVIPLSVDGLQEEGSIAVGEGGVWAISADKSTIVRVDPATNQETGTYPAPEGATAIRAGFGALWVTSWSTDTLYRLDPATGTIQAAIEVGGGPRFLAVGEDGVWVLNQTSSTVSHVDPATNSMVADVDVDDYPVRGGDIAVGGGAVWARVSGKLVTKIDASTDEVVATYGPGAGSGSVAADVDAVWISAHDVNAVWRLPLD